MNIVIDKGNTLCKLAVFGESQEPVEVLASPAGDPDCLGKVLNKYKPKACIVSSVTTFNEDIKQILKARIPFVLELDHGTPLPIKNEYETPETLGMDRIAAAVGAWSIQPGKDSLVIDMGTAITYDLISKNGVFEGGNIAPGLNLRLKALHEFTGRLPEVSAKPDFEEFGRNTEKAIRAGVMQGIVYEVNGYLDHYKKKFPDLFAFLTGGDLIYFAEKLKNGIFVSGNLVLIGLNKILNYNVDQK
jgi:type III pantothenate kinase